MKVLRGTVEDLFPQRGRSRTAQFETTDAAHAETSLEANVRGGGQNVGCLHTNHYLCSSQRSGPISHGA